MVGRLLAHLLGWLPGAALAWLAAPFAIPEAWRVSSAGPPLLSALHVLIALGLLFVAGRGALAEPSAPVGAWRVLATGALIIGASVVSFLWAGLAPTRDVVRRCHDGPIGGVACERFTLGFSPDIPFYRLQLGEIAPGACPAAGEPAVRWPVVGETRDLEPTACPPGLAGARCYEARWTGASSGAMLLFVAVDPSCARGLELFGRGSVASARRDRLGAL